MAALKVAVLISGRGTNLQALIDACAAPGFPAALVAVISNVPGAAGIAQAEAAGIATLTIDHRRFDSRDAFEAALQAALADCGAELVCLAGFMRLLTPSFVRQWQDRLINIHPSLLPAYRGLDTHRRIIEDGTKVAGCTVHFVRPEMDDGPIIVQAAVAVRDDDTPETLAARILAQEHRCLPAVVRWIAEGRVRVDGARVIVDGIAPAAAALINPPP